MTPESIEKTAETIHFCGRSIAAKGDASWIARIHARRPIAVGVGLGMLGVLLAGTLGIPTGWIIAVALAIVPGVLLLRYARSAQHDQAVRGLPCDDRDHLCRLRCVGLPSALLPEGPLLDLPFEPRIFRSPFTRGMELPHAVAVLGCLAVAVALVGATAARAGFSVALVQVGKLSFVVAITLVLLFMEWLSPTYLRIVPGRLDVMEFGVFLRGRARVTRYDLRTAKVVVDLRQLAVFIDDEEKDVHAELAIAFVRDRYRLAYYVLLAALSTYEPGPLPDDALVG